MTVKELIEILNEYDQDANVFLLTQPDYPFEYSIKGVTSREDYEEFDNMDEDNETDVLIMEYKQERSGSKKPFGGF